MDFKRLFFITLLCVAVESVFIGAVVLHIIVLRSDFNWLMVSVPSTTDVIVNDDVRPADERVEERGDFNWPIEERPWLSVPTTIGVDTDRPANSGERVEEQRGHAGLTWPTEERPSPLKAVLQKAATFDIGTNRPADEGVEEHFHKLQVYDVQVDRSHAHFLPPKLWHTSHTVKDVAVQNVDKCLTATKLTNYFSAQGYLHHAHSNAQHLLTALKELIPSKFIDRFNDHCWNVTADLYHSHPAMLQLYPSGNKTNTLLQRTAKFNALSSPNPQSFIACLPRIFLLGFNKCGSTFFYSMIATHPFIARPTKKEPKWWFMAPLTTSRNIDLLVANYLKYFMPLMDRIAQGESSLLTIDGTPGNMYKWPGFQNEITDICLLPSIIPEILPKSKFLVIMRNPVTMLYSAFWSSCTRRYGHVTDKEKLKGPEIFHRRVVATIKKFNSCIQVSPLTKCVYDTFDHQYLDGELVRCGYIQVYEAFYFMHIQKWLSIVPRDRFLFLTLDELSENTNTVVERVWKFIGIPSPNSYVTSDIKQNLQSKVEYHSEPHLMMRNETKRLLQDFFRPYNRRLAELLQDSKFLWKDSTV